MSLTSRDAFERIEASAQRHGWSEIATRDPHLRSFVRSSSGNGERLNLYPSTGTVGTCLQHPSRPTPTQLFRRGIGISEVEKLLENPRTHTGCGYYRRDLVWQGTENLFRPKRRPDDSYQEDDDSGDDSYQEDDDSYQEDDDSGEGAVSPSVGERLAGFGGDVNLFNDYHCGLVDSDGEPTDYSHQCGGSVEEDCYSSGGDSDDDPTGNDDFDDDLDCRDGGLDGSEQDPCDHDADYWDDEEDCSGAEDSSGGGDFSSAGGDSDDDWDESDDGYSS